MYWTTGCRTAAGSMLLERLRAKGSAAPIILISGYDFEGTDSRAKALRVFDIIQKPFSRDALCNALKMSIESAATVSPSNGGEVNASLGQPPKKRSTKAIQIGAIILLTILVGVTIYLLTVGH
jgi:CheY-like chemotaxis protein